MKRRHLSSSSPSSSIFIFFENFQRIGGRRGDLQRGDFIAMATDREGSYREFWCGSCNTCAVVPSYSSSGVCPDCGGSFREDFEELQSPAETLAFQAEEEFGRIGEFDDGMELPLRGLDWNLWDEPSPSNIEDYYEVVDRLLSYIVASTSEEQVDPSFDASDSEIPRPAAKSYVDSIPGFEITEELISADPFLCCAVCKEDFVVHTEVKKLLCDHIYHPDCIFPWLSRHSSCPVCRFRLPTDDPLRRQLSGVVAAELQNDQIARDVREIHRMLMALFPGRNMPSVEDPDTLPEIRVDFLGIDPILRRIAARHRLAFSGRSDGDASSSETASMARTAGDRAEDDGDPDVAEARTLLN